MSGSLGLFHVGLVFANKISIFHVMVLAVLFLLVLCGNISVLVATFPNRKKSTMNFFIMNLATADLLVALLSILPDLVWKISIEFHGGLFLCRLMRLLMGHFVISTVMDRSGKLLTLMKGQFVKLTSGQPVLETSGACGSPFALIALSIDRLDAIARPFRFSSSRHRQCVIQVGVGWFFAVVLNIPALAFVKIRIKQEYGRQCWMKMSREGFQIYYNLVITVTFFCPVLIIAICHIAIVFIIYSEGRNNVQAVNARTNTGISRAKMKTIKMTCVIVTTFILCWLPYVLWNYLIIYGVVIQSTSLLRSLTIVINQLGTLNALANPIIFWIFTRRVPPDQRNSCLPCYRRNNDPYRRASLNNRAYFSNSNVHYRTRLNNNSFTVHTNSSSTPRHREEMNLQEPLILKNRHLGSELGCNVKSKNSPLPHEIRSQCV